jgi:hypothetical protein
MKEAPVELQYAPQPDPAWNSNNKMAGEVYGWQSRFFFFGPGTFFALQRRG